MKAAAALPLIDEVVLTMMTDDQSIGGITVVIPLHNKGSHIERALDSVLAQSLRPCSILVVDDASSDDGPKRVRGYCDPRVQLLTRDQPGPGGYAARNLAVETATTRWIAFLDADDAWEPEHLADLVRAILAAPNEPVLACSAYVIRHPGRPQIVDKVSQHSEVTEDRHLDTAAFLSLWIRVQECPVWTSAILARRDVLLEAGLFPAGRARRGGDKYLWLSAALQGDVVIAPRFTAIYFKDAENMVTRADPSNLRHCLCDLIDEKAPAQPPVVRELLNRIKDMEIYNYSVRTLKRERLRRSTWRGFRVHRQPAQAALLALGTFGPAFRLIHSMLRVTGRA